MLTTTIHMYRFDVSKRADAEAYGQLRAKLTAQGATCFETWGGNREHYQPAWDGLSLTLETEYVFDNQWNTAPVPGVSTNGLRVFDWAQDYKPEGYNKNIKQGHYLDMTPEMVEVRANRMKCGYCGKQYDRRDNPPAFCSACLGSEYLKAEDLKLTRVEPVCNPTFAPLTQEETAALMPVYLAEQAGKGSERARIARERYGLRLEKDRAEKISKAEAKYERMKWLFDRGCPVRLLENCIYYDHTDTVTFGWRDPIRPGADLDWLTENLKEFPYKHEVKTAKA